MSMLAKFILVIFIGKYLSIEKLGEYGLFTTTITIAIYFLGLDFYTFNTREILAKNKSDRVSLIRDQFIFHLLVYTIVLPLLLFVFVYNILDSKYIVHFYLILIFEHISQEIFRLYTTLQKPLFANFLLFLRSGIWIYAVIGMWLIHIKALINLSTVWYGWIIGTFLSVSLGIFHLLKEYDFKKLEKIDWKWIFTGIKVSFPFFIGTFAFKIIELSDRYMIDFFMTKADVGVYTFFGNIANSLNIIVFTLIIMIYYPKLVEAYQNKEMERFSSILNKFSYKTKVFSFIFAGIIALLLWPLLIYLGKTQLQNSIIVFWVLLVSNIVLNLSFVHHYVLYAAKKDEVIKNATLIGALTNIILNIFLIKNYGILGAATATTISYILIFWIKSYKRKEIFIS